MFNKVGRKLQSLFLDGRLRINRSLGLPAQTGKDIQIFKKIFDNCAPRKKLKIFEWGSGLSTIYYSEYIRKTGIAVEWHSIDNNKNWHEKVSLMVKQRNLEPSIKLYLREFAPFWEKLGWGAVPPPCGVFGPKSENEIAYIKFPFQIGSKFDIMIIDARFRRHCIQTTRELLLPNGIAVLHDAQKAHYHAGLNEFRHSAFFDSGTWYPFQSNSNKVWIGSMENEKIFEFLKSI